jgi:hypothetical protein
MPSGSKENKELRISFYFVILQLINLHLDYLLVICDGQSIGIMKIHRA